MIHEVKSFMTLFQLSQIRYFLSVDLKLEFPPNTFKNWKLKRATKEASF